MLLIRSHVVWVMQAVQKAQTPMVAMARLVVVVFFHLDQSRLLRLVVQAARPPPVLLILATAVRVAR